MTPEKKAAFGQFETILDDAMAELSKIITYKELAEYFEDVKIIDLW